MKKRSIFIVGLVIIFSLMIASVAFAEEITVVTSYGGDDGNRGNYEAAVKMYEEQTGNKVNDESGTSNEEWKAKIMTDFETGAEPDVLFFFNGVDSNPFVKAGKVVSIDEIREVYPDYASNMKDSMLGASPVDGKNYSVPVNGYWEGLFVNKKVLDEAGVAVPGADYTWEQFLNDCEKIKTAGFTCVAVSLQEVPHYWFEYTVFNHGSVANHLDIPKTADDAVAQKWAAGLEDIKVLYEKGYLPANTLTATDAETFQLMADHKAAFAIDGSWKIGWFQSNADDINNFTVTYVPAQGDRAATDIIGGLSMGYYITRKAWNDPEKQKACVDFVGMMTSDDVVSTFGATAVTALKKGTTPPQDADALVTAALAMTKGATGISPAVQDLLTGEARADLFANVKNVVTGKITATDAIASMISFNQ
ncbi:MAG TPA: ABC transporter substrate-binding protein [Flexilinea sp.]|jgi:raffinose/stachyose/melibiose transport system substrate-binding protein|nr:ABC transporter substrate-binding protein [Flexilinea sp.]HOG22444.1 ABC transporter substrate-binding protein [Flexilinea sp.]HOP01822.1 ABC transporter substrate-binding protein [Flexilinea sp.]HOR56443.1 ABC transporter substrate-binding protein [Flexilinea sp.]HOU19657.1 ABC transporter substrate-binding protein [Flexilinea sp.]